MNDSAVRILETVTSICQRYHISALQPFLHSCRTFATETTLNVAILGRFKTGKSSFLNQPPARSSSRPPGPAPRPKRPRST
jgi:GTP-binding protein EngB required for normal cell division